MAGNAENPQSQPLQQQEMPSTTAKMRPRPNRGEESYPGLRSLGGRAGSDHRRRCRHGRAVAIAFAREGADILISYFLRARGRRGDEALDRESGTQSGAGARRYPVILALPHARGSRGGGVGWLRHTREQRRPSSTRLRSTPTCRTRDCILTRRPREQSTTSPASWCKCWPNTESGELRRTRARLTP